MRYAGGVDGLKVLISIQRSGSTSIGARASARLGDDKKPTSIARGRKRKAYWKGRQRKVAGRDSRIRTADFTPEGSFVRSPFVNAVLE